MTAKTKTEIFLIKLGKSRNKAIADILALHERRKILKKRHYDNLTTFTDDEQTASKKALTKSIKELDGELDRLAKIDKSITEAKNR